MIVLPIYRPLPASSGNTSPSEMQQILGSQEYSKEENAFDSHAFEDEFFFTPSDAESCSSINQNYNLPVEPIRSSKAHETKLQLQRGPSMSFFPKKTQESSAGSLASFSNKPISAEERSQSTALQNSKKDSSKRRDVVNKAILRSFRKFYLKSFNEFFNYPSKKKRKGAEFYSQCLDTYIAAQFPQVIGTQEQDMKFYLGALLYSKDMKRAANSEREKSEIGKLHSCLYSYSQGKLKELFKICSLGRLFQKFYMETQEQDEDKKLASEDKTDIYMEALENMRAHFEASV